MSQITKQNMKRLFLYLTLVLFVAASAEHKHARKWVPLFNGKDLSDWKVKIRGHALGDNFANTFSVSDGAMKVNYDGYENFNEQFGHIYYAKKFSHYLLSIEYRFIGEQAKGGPGWAIRNSGVMVHCQAPETVGLAQDFPISIEVQFLGGNGKDERHTANLCTPGTHVVYKGSLLTDHCINSTSKTYHGDQWVNVDVLVLGDSRISHIVNGDTVLTYEKPQIGGGAVTDFDSKVKVDGKALTEGYISLQSESHPIEFRKVELFDLAPYASNPAKLKKILNELKTRR
jgi:hypothetical protein